MKEPRGSTRAGLLLIMLTMLGCSDPATRLNAPAAESSDRVAVEAQNSPTAERAALGKLGRIIATSLAEKSARNQLKAELRAAPFKEHKLQLGSFLRGEVGKQLIARTKPGNSDEVLTLLAQVRPLEFYMPVRQHRETWVGDEEVLVAVQLEEEDPIIAFNARGEEIRLTGDAPPEQPTLSIVPVETEFDRPMPSNSRNVSDRGGQAIGTLMPANFNTSSLIAIDDGSGGGGSGGGSGGSTSIPPGLYMEFSRILDVHEPFTKGEPEIEVHIHGPTDQGDPKLGKDLSCAAATPYDPRKAFDQNGGFWEGRVMLFSADEIARYNEKFADGFHVLFWEDDDTPCVIKLDSNTLLEVVRSTARAFGTVAIKIVVPKSPWYILPGAFLAVFFENAGSWLLSNDDFVGSAVAQGSAGYFYPDNTHVIMTGTTLNGRVTLVYR